MDTFWTCYRHILGFGHIMDMFYQNVSKKCPSLHRAPAPAQARSFDKKCKQTDCKFAIGKVTKLADWPHNDETLSITHVRSFSSPGRCSPRPPPTRPPTDSSPATWTSKSLATKSRQSRSPTSRHSLRPTWTTSIRAPRQVLGEILTP